MEDMSIIDTGTNEKLIKKENILLLISAVLLGIVFDVLFHGKTLGVSYPIFILVFYLVLLWNFRKEIEFKFNFAWFLSLPILALSFTYLIYANDVFMVLNFMGLPFLIIAQTVLLTHNNKHKWYFISFMNDIFYGMFVRMYAHVFKPFALTAKIISRKTNYKKYSGVYKVILGLAISIPLVLVVVLLLSSADQVFGHFVNKIPNIFKNIKIGEFIARLVVIVVSSAILFSYLWSLMNRRHRTDSGVQEDAREKKGVFDPIIVVTILISINIIYVLFTFIQFSYLFGSMNYDLPVDFTYSEYARRGFFELIVVTLINLSILLINVNLTKITGRATDKIMRILNSLLIVCTLIMLFSAHYRMSMYEEAYGYTYLRILTHAFMAFIFVLMTATLIKVWFTRMSLLKSYIVIALISYVSINYINIDVIIAKNNIDRYYTNNVIDTSYLTCLSPDAIPVLTQLVDDKNKDVASDIENYLYIQKDKLQKPQSWQSFNIAKHRAKEALTPLELKYQAKEIMIRN